MTYPERLERLPSLGIHEAGLTMRVVGWLLLVHDAMFVAFFAPASWRVGSLLWPIWAVVQALVGVTLAAAGTKKEETTTVIAGSVVPMSPKYRQPEAPRTAA